ncbi:hypothetical protein D3C86_1704230 [compost metagenome]
MAFQICFEWRSSLCCVDGFCLLLIFRECRKDYLECLVLDHHVVRVDQCSLEKFSSGEQGTAIVYLYNSKPFGADHFKNHLQCIADDVADGYCTYFLYPGI